MRENYNWEPNNMIQILVLSKKETLIFVKIKTFRFKKYIAGILLSAV